MALPTHSCAAQALANLTYSSMRMSTQDVSSQPPIIAFGLSEKAILPPAQLLARTPVFAPPPLQVTEGNQILSRESTQASEGTNIPIDSFGSPSRSVVPHKSPSPDCSRGFESSDQHTSPPPVAQKPVKWAERLCHTTFFGPCSHHSSKMYRRCECTHFCMDCNESCALCSCCLSDHSSCHTLQIRRYVYRDVVKVCDVQQFLDTTGIQTYTVNHAQAIFLSAKDKAQVGPYYRVDSSSSCITCHRGLRNGCQYCSLACKLAATQGITPPEPSKEQRARAPKAAPRSDKAALRPLRCSVGDESQSDDATQLNASLPPSGGSTPTACAGLVLQSTDMTLSPAVSQVLDRGVKRPAQASSGMPARRKQLRPTRAVE